MSSSAPFSPPFSEDTKLLQKAASYRARQIEAVVNYFELRTLLCELITTPIIQDIEPTPMERQPMAARRVAMTGLERGIMQAAFSIRLEEVEGRDGERWGAVRRRVFADRGARESALREIMRRRRLREVGNDED